jgi:hypothetical protein
MPNQPTAPPASPSAATRRVQAALTVADANDARSIYTPKGSGWGFRTTVELAPGQQPRAIADRLAKSLNVRVEVGNVYVIVYWNQDRR